MFNLFEEKGQTDLHIKYDAASGLKAIIAIDNTHLGPALGGCRFIEYHSTELAIQDAIRLARGMTYKAALANVPQGGGKAVIIKSPHYNREAIFDAFGEFVEELNGRYITAIDCGTAAADMDIVKHHTQHATSTTASGDPSPYTATGVFAGIQAAVNFKLERNDLTDIHVAIQGLGKVGSRLAMMLHEAGAKLSVTDIDHQKCRHIAEQTGANITAPEAIYNTDCDVFAPCGLGAVINDTSIKQLQCHIVAGSANNQLDNDDQGKVLHDQDILYAPDFIINAGGLIYASLNHIGQDTESILERTYQINTTLNEVFCQAKLTHRPTSDVAIELAEKKLLH